MTTSPQPETAGKECVWDYPRPPRLEPTPKQIRVECSGVVLADSRSAFRVLETSHPPTYYLPPGDVDFRFLTAAGGGSFCEWKGEAVYWTVRVGEREAVKAAWGYPRPTAGFVDLADHVAFYCAAMDECLVDGERARPQPGGFYGGWVTDDLAGPFKGEPGSWGW